MSDNDRVVTWAFWAAAALAAAGGVAPLLFGGGINSRLAGVLLPFAVAAVAMAVIALFNQYGRLFTMLLYFVAGVAMVYGVLGMLAIKLSLLVAGSCDPAPAACPSGFQRPLTATEDSSVNVVVTLAVLSILAGFYGLMVMYRRRPPFRTPMAAASMPEPTTSAKPAPPAPAPVIAKSETHAEPKAEAADEPKELLAHAEPKELPEPVELKELPPPA